jgi:hypothetical protein
LLPPRFNSIIGAGVYTASTAIYTNASFLKDVRLIFFRKADSLTETHSGTGSAAYAFSGVDMGQVLYSTLLRVMFHKTSKKRAACIAQAHLDLRNTRRSVSLLYGIARKVSSPRLTLRKGLFGYALYRGIMPQGGAALEQAAGKKKRLL